ncbi:response regulator transcription factor [uncultured Microbacterium sp.]|uniref:response regulator n=1 Tax=uncultured Microbacterium sp. TaxID=191216 RepID=UPI0025ECD2B8|nr:response regulator transcription factor [uncultured Microbacterium sp.]
MTAAAADLGVLIVDDNRTVRRGIRLRLENASGIRVVGEAANGPDAIVRARAENADVVLMDLHMPGMSGIEATRMITAENQGCRVILLTSEVSDAFVLDALEAGASGYLLKGHDSDQLLPVIRGAAAGTATISPRVAPRLIRELREARPLPAAPHEVSLLTAAETRVVALLSSGVTATEDIARHLSVSINTVRSQTASALRKLDLSDRTQLALWGARNGLQRRDPSSIRMNS